MLYWFLLLGIRDNELSGDTIAGRGPILNAETFVSFVINYLCSHLNCVDVANDLVLIGIAINKGYNSPLTK